MLSRENILLVLFLYHLKKINYVINNFVVAAEREESLGHRSSSLTARKDQARHYVISSSSSSSSRSRSSSRSGGRSRSPKHRRSNRHKHSSKRRHSGSRKRSYSRSRSRSHGPATSGYGVDKRHLNYGTNSTDPKLIASRLFLGCLPFDITKDDIRGIFCKYGKIIGKN